MANRAIWWTAALTLTWLGSFLIPSVVGAGVPPVSAIVAPATPLGPPNALGPPVEPGSIPPPKPAMTPDADEPEDEPKPPAATTAPTTDEPDVETTPAPPATPPDALSLHRAMVPFDRDRDRQARPLPDHAPSFTQRGRILELRRWPDDEPTRRYLTWRIEYRLAWNGSEALTIDPAEVRLTAEAWVSNSRSEGHGRPRHLAHALTAGPDGGSTATLIDHNDPTAACDERAALAVWPEREGRRSPPVAAPSGQSELTEPFRLEPGEVLRLRLLLSHRHGLQGPAEPLLGARRLTARIGPAVFEDRVPLDRPVEPAEAPPGLDAVPKKRRDPRIFHTPPDSLLLDAGLPGFRTFEFAELPVRRDRPLRLSFWYYRAPNSEGGATALLKQYRTVPGAFRPLTDARIEVPLETLGRWTLIDHAIPIEPDATALRLRFELDSDDQPSALWIDDLALRPLHGPRDGP